jgi:hypothetical protein
MEISPENTVRLFDSLIDFTANIVVMRKILVDAGIVDEKNYEALYQAKRQELIVEYQSRSLDLQPL